MKRLRMDCGAGRRDIPLVGTIAVGRDERCAINTVDARLSRHHAEFFVDSSNFAWVHDMSSTNGIRVNDVETKHALLHPGDVIEIADLRIEFLDDEPVRPDLTCGWTRVGGAAEKQPAANAHDDFGVASRPALSAESDIRPPMRLAPPNAGTPAQTVLRRWPAAASDDGRREGRHVARIGLPLRQPVIPPVRRLRDGAWRSEVFIIFVTVALLTWIAAATAAYLTRRSEVGALQVSHAVSLAGLLAADAGRALEHDAGDTATLDALVAQPAFTAARILRPDGLVLAPSVQMNQAVTSIPGFGVAPANVRRKGATLVGREIQALSPVITKRGRIAVVWVTIGADHAAESMLSGLSLAGSCVAGIVAGLLGAFLLHKRTLSGLRRLSEDVDLAARGDIDGVADPLGIAPLADIAEAVDYLAKNVRPWPRMAQDALERPHAAPARDHPQSVPRPDEAWLIANEQMRIVELGPGADRFLQTRASIGAHVVDAFADSTVSDAVLVCIARLTTATPSRVALPATATRSALAIVVDRQENAQIRVMFCETQG